MKRRCNISILLNKQTDEKKDTFPQGGHFTLNTAIKNTGDGKACQYPFTSKQAHPSSTKDRAGEERLWVYDCAIRGCHLLRTDPGEEAESMSSRRGITGWVSAGLSYILMSVGMWSKSQLCGMLPKDGLKSLHARSPLVINSVIHLCCGYDPGAMEQCALGPWDIYGSWILFSR
ncbi:hypothetical protein STEG23_028113 [Scotinomys teguina]